MPYMQLPSGTWLEVPNGIPYDRAMATAKAQLPQEFGIKPEEGMGAQVRKGAATAMSQMGTGIRSLSGNASEAAQRGLSEQQAIDQKYGGSRGWEDVAAKYNDPNGGIFPALGEGAKFAGEQLASMAPMMGTSMATGRLGAMGGAALGSMLAPGPGTVAGGFIGGAAGAVAPWALQMLGSNVEQQQQVTPGEINVGAAGAAAVPQAAIGMAAHFIPFGRTLVGKMFGPAAAKALAAGDQAGVQAAAQRSLSQAAARGVVLNAGVQVPAMVAQDMLGRLQAGQPIADDEALTSYGHAAFTGAALSPLGAIGGMSERGTARTKVARQEQIAQGERVRAAAEAETARKQTPEYLQELSSQYDTLTGQRNELAQQLKALRGDKSEDAAAQKQDLSSQLGDVRKALGEIEPEVKKRAADIAALKQQQANAPLHPMEVLAGQQAPADVADTSFVDMATQPPPAAPAAAPAPNALDAFMRAQQDPNAAAVGENTMTSRDVVAALVQRPDLAKRVLSSGERFPGAPDVAQSNLWKKELATQLKAALAEPQSNALPIQSYQQGLEQIEANRVTAEGQEIGAAREHAAAQSAVERQIADVKAAEEQRRAAAEAAASRAAPDAAAQVREQGLQLGDARRTPAGVKTLENAVDEGVLTPSLASTLRLPKITEPVDLKTPEGAAQVLPALQARISDLVDQQHATLGNEKVQLTDADGNLTPNGREMQRVEAHLAELRRLQAHATEATRPGPAADEALTQSVIESAAPRRTPSINVGQKQGLQPQQYAALAKELATQHENLMLGLTSNLEELGGGAIFADPRQTVRGPSTASSPKHAQRMEQSIVRDAVAARRAIVDNMVQEAAARREATGAPGLTQAEAMQAATRVHAAVNAIIGKAQRGTKGIHDAVTSLEDTVNQIRAKLMEPPAQAKGRVQKGEFALTPQTERRTQLEEQRAAGAGLATEGQQANQRIENTIDRLEQAQQRSKGTGMVDARGLGMTRALLEKTRQFLLGTTETTRRDRDGAPVQARLTTSKVGAELLDRIDSTLERFQKGIAADPAEARAILDRIAAIEREGQDQRQQGTLDLQPREAAPGQTAHDPRAAYLEAASPEQFQRMLDSRAKSAGAMDPKFKAWQERLDENIARTKVAVERLSVDASAAGMQPGSKEAARQFERAKVLRSKAEQELERLNELRTVLTSINEPSLEGKRSALVRQVAKVNAAAEATQKALDKAQAQAKATAQAATRPGDAFQHAVEKLTTHRDELAREVERGDLSKRNELDAVQARLDRANEQLAKRNVAKAEPARAEPTFEQPPEPAGGQTVTKAHVEPVPIVAKRGGAKYELGGTSFDEAGNYIAPPQRRVVETAVAQSPEARKQAERDALREKVREELEDRARQKALKDELRSRGVAQEMTAAERRELRDSMKEGAAPVRSEAGAKFADEVRAAFGASRARGEQIRKNLPSTSKGRVEPGLRTSKAEPPIEDMPGTLPPVKTPEREVPQGSVTGGAQREIAEQRQGSRLPGVNTPDLRAKVLKAQADAAATKERARKLRESQAESKKKFSETDVVPEGSTSPMVHAEAATLFDPAQTERSVTVAESVDALPPSLRSKVPKNAQAVTADGHVYLIADRIAPGATRGVLLHELGVHVGMDEATVDKLHAQIVRMSEGEGADAARAKKALAAQARSKSVGLDETPDTRDEAVAHFVEMAVNEGINPSRPGTLARIFKPLVDMVKAALVKMGLRTENMTPRDIVDYAFGAAGKALTMPALHEGLSYSQKPRYETGFDAELQHLSNSLIKQPTPWSKKMRDAAIGFRYMVIDSKDALQKFSEQMGDKLAATQMMYLVRQYEHRNNYMHETLANGALTVKKLERADGQTEYVVGTNPGASAVKIAKVLGRVQGMGNEAAVEQQFKTYLVAKRAEGMGAHGYEAALGHDVTPEQIVLLKKAAAAGDANPIFQEARVMHREFSDGLIDFAVETGAMDKGVADKLKKAGDYVSWYRANGDALELVVNGERVGTIGNLKTQPHLKELVGGDSQITGYFEGLIRNANLLTDMALRNLATKSVANTFEEMGLAKIGKGAGPTNALYKNVLRFKDHGADKFALLDTDAMGEKGVPAELIVQGMEGMTTQMHAAIKALGIPANIFRHFVLRNPAFAFKQVVRDAGQNYLIDGVDGAPVLSQLGAIKRLVENRGELMQQMSSKALVGGQTLTGTTQDQKIILHEMMSGKLGLSSMLAKLDHTAMLADTASRLTSYESGLARGLSEMEAIHYAQETMNFARRGASPSMRALNTVIPFMNAQIQGLDVLYRALRGQLPFNERLEIRNKLITRGMMLAAGTMAYASLMQDDDEYKKATDNDRYNNFFVKIPGTTQTLKVPVPFEAGYIFKSLPEMLMNNINGTTDARRTMDAMGALVMNAVPGGMPQGVKPLVEGLLNHSFYSGQDIENKQMQGMQMSERFGPATTETAKKLAGSTIVNGREIGVSPVMLEHLVRGYTGSLGMALMGLADGVFSSATQKPESMPWNNPVYGQLLVNKDLSSAIDRSYSYIEQMTRAKNTMDNMIKQGRTEDAQAFAQKFSAQIAQAGFAQGVQKQLGSWAQLKKQVALTPNLDAEKKRALIESINASMHQYATQANEAFKKLATE